MYTLLPQINPKNSEFRISENTSGPNNMPIKFLSEAVFAGGIFWNLEAVFGRVDGVLKTAQAIAEEPWKSLHIERSVKEQ
uniref:Peptide-methionine (S)-S-oxide reductase n=1 Tax=Quercus lobata TaxID=97700 RepID=A0A7N2KWG8_QUELO